MNHSKLKWYNHNKTKQNKTWCIFDGTYCVYVYRFVCVPVNERRQYIVTSSLIG